MMRGARMTGALLAAVLLAGAPAADSKGKKKKMELEVTEHLSTAAGLLEIQKTGEAQYRVVLAGKPLAPEEAESIGIAASFPKTGKPSVVLLQIGGGSGCPAEYRVVSAPAASAARLSDEFGNCSDVPTVSFENGALRVVFPPFKEAEEEIWLYDTRKQALVQQK